MQTEGRFEGIAQEFAAEGVKLTTFGGEGNADRWARDAEGRSPATGLSENDVIVSTSEGRWDARSEQAGIVGAALARQRFGMGFTYSLSPLRTESGLDAPGFGVVRDDTKDCLAVVGNRFDPAQPSDLDVIDRVSGDKPIDRGGIFGRGKVVWLQTREDTVQTPSGPAETRILVASACDGSLGFTIGATAVVVACRNTFAKALAGARHTCKHTKNMRARIDGIAKLYEAARDETQRFGTISTRLAETKVDDEQVDAVVNVIFGDRPEKRASRWDAAIGRFKDGYWTAPGAVPETAWGLVQAATYYTSHDATVRGDRWESQVSGRLGQIEDKALVYVRQIAPHAWAL